MTRTKSLADIKRKTSVKLIGEVSEAELAVRIIEAMGNCRRPAGVTAADVLAHTAPDVSASALAAARSALTYMAECFANAVNPS